jgi:putative ABC transport system permease protein
MEDLDKLPNVANSYGGILGQELASYGSDVKKTIIWGVSASYIDIDNTGIDYGRFYTKAEDKSLAPVIVLGPKIKDQLFGESDPIGKLVKIQNSKFKVIGVMEERGAVMSMDFDEFIYMPVRTLQKRVMGVDHLSFTIHQLHNIDIADETAAEMRVILRENHNISPPEGERQGWTDTGKDDFRVVTMQEMMEIMGVITGALTYLLLAIVAISLVVGGVGILNIMYVIVSERTKEIGLRKAVGAKYSDIMQQFLVESVLITIVGGVIGIFFGVLVSYLISFAANYSGIDWTFVIPLRAFVTALIFSLVFGVLFGVYPARKAARMDPMTALFSE